jgi:hypothetical protein
MRHPKVCTIAFHEHDQPQKIGIDSNGPAFDGLLNPSIEVLD